MRVRVDTHDVAEDAARAGVEPCDELRPDCGDLAIRVSNLNPTIERVLVALYELHDLKRGDVSLALNHPLILPLP